MIQLQPKKMKNRLLPNLKLQAVLGNLLILLSKCISQGHDIGSVVIEDKVAAKKSHGPR